MILYVKDAANTQYTFKNVVSRVDPSLLVPSTTTLSVYPDRITSNDYTTFTSNLVLSFYL
jgi:hypothetical protein